MVKIVNQMAMGLSNAIYLETIGYGVKMGINPDVMVKAIGGDDGWRRQFEGIAQRIKNDQATHTDVKFVQLRQFAEDAAANGYLMPLTRALFEFMDSGERISQEEIYPAPSFWHELMKDRGQE
jgi:3-hydroxyisobutyrate dehydrogenase-like beta-hydroxyacid dehydrogenase